MISNRRDLAGHPRPAGRAGAGPASGDLEQASDSTLIELISRGSVPAFVALFDRTVEAVRAELAALSDDARFGQVLASTYVEVWWLAGCHRAPGIDATDWLTGIVRRRIDDALRGTTRQGMDPAAQGPRPSYSELEMAALLRRPVGNLLGV